MLLYRRKPNSGKMFMQSRKGGSKARAASMKTFYPGDTIQVESKENLPGWPHSVDGWELVGPVEENGPRPVPNPKKDYLGVGKCLDVAVLEAVRQRGDQWKVIIKEPGLNYTTQDKIGAVLPVGAKVHTGYVTEGRAKAWAEAGYDQE